MTDHAHPTPSGNHLPSQDAAVRLLELAGEYVKGVLADTSSLLELAQDRVQAIPATPRLALEVQTAWREIGALIMRHGALELTVQEQGRQLATLRAEMQRLRTQLEVR